MFPDEVGQINRAYPELPVHSIRPVTNAGQFSNVFIVNDTLVFRFPRNHAVAQAMAREVNLLRAVQGRVTLPVPNPIFVHTDPDSGILVFMGYVMLPGEPMTANLLVHQDGAVVRRMAQQLAGFLRAFHAIPPDSLDMTLPTEGTRDEWAKLYEEFRQMLYPFMRPDARAQVNATFDTALNDAALWHFTPVLRHGDFGTRNLLYDPAEMRATGVIDFSASGVGDPAQDVGAVWSLGEKLMPYFFDYYPEMRATLPRVKFISCTYALQQALYALRDGNQADFDDEMRDYCANK